MSIHPPQYPTRVAWITAICATAILIGGCAGTRMAQIDPANAAIALEKGDRVEITRKGGEFVPLKVAEVSSTEIVGDDARVPLDDVVAITKLVKYRSTDENGVLELIGWIGAILIWAAIL